MAKVKIKVEFDPTPIRHMAIQCPSCKKWFKQYDISDGITYRHDIDSCAKCLCPACLEEFDLEDVDIDENVSFPEFYDECAKRVVKWE